MTPQAAITLIMFIAIIISVVAFLRANETVTELQEKIDDLYSDIQILEIREMHLKDQLKDAMTEADFLYS